MLPQYQPSDNSRSESTIEVYTLARLNHGSPAVGSSGLCCVSTQRTCHVSSRLRVFLFMFICKSVQTVHKIQYLIRHAHFKWIYVFIIVLRQTLIYSWSIHWPPLVHRYIPPHAHTEHVPTIEKHQNVHTLGNCITSVRVIFLKCVVCSFKITLAP